MPHTKSAKKNLRKSEKRRLYNRAVKRTLRTHLKRFLAAAPEQMQAEYNQAAMRLDKAASRGVIHKNLAARKKSQMARLMLKKKAAKPAG
ncbi:MAG: 30S ribosomal protein S20 [Gemmataceae bacterium]